MDAWKLSAVTYFCPHTMYSAFIENKTMSIHKVGFFGFTYFILCFSASAQKPYLASAGETIFSVGIVGSDSIDLSPVVRFSPVFNLQQQFHYDFSDRVGIYTGLGVRNVGLITHYIDSFNNKEKIKERSYSLGLPLALKFGDLKDGINFALGGEAEIMFAYKRKIKLGDHKDKDSEWFSDNVNLFNPSVFAEVKFNKGQYIRLKYYILDFLNYQGVKLLDGEFLSDYGPESPLFYVSLGVVTLQGKSKKQEANPQPTESTYLKSNKKLNSAAEIAGTNVSPVK